MTAADPVRLLALDVSLNSTGVCYPSGQIARLCPPKGARGGERLAWWADTFHDLLATTQPTRLVVEAPTPGNRNRGNTAAKLAELYGILWAELHRYGPCLLTLVPASTLKKQATGNGRADKDAMRSAAMQSTLHDPSDTYEMIKAANDDEIDAWWLWTLTRQGVFG